MGNFFKRIIDWLLSLFSKEETTEIENVDSGITPTDSAETETIEIEEPEMHNLVILIDNGHASSTPGKRSPKDDNIPQFFEYEFNRDIARRLAKKLDELGFTYHLLVPEVDDDISLTERAKRANAYCKEYGVEKCLFISIHANAAGNGSCWSTAKGWCCYTSKGETVSDEYAETFMNVAKDVLEPYEKTIRKWSQKKYSWEENYTVLVKTKCAAILTENLFYDNKNEVLFLESEEGREAITQIHVEAIKKIEELIEA